MGTQSSKNISCACGLGNSTSDLVMRNELAPSTVSGTAGVPTARVHWGRDELPPGFATFRRIHTSYYVNETVTVTTYTSSTTTTTVTGSPTIVWADTVGINGGNAIGAVAAAPTTNTTTTTTATTPTFTYEDNGSIMTVTDPGVPTVVTITFDKWLQPTARAAEPSSSFRTVVVPAKEEKRQPFGPSPEEYEEAAAQAAMTLEEVPA